MASESTNDTIGARGVLEGEAAKAVPCGHDNFSDISLHREFQNGRKAFAFPVDAGSNICDDDTLGTVPFEETDLSLKVVLLPPRGHSSIADDFSVVFDLEISF